MNVVHSEKRLALFGGSKAIDRTFKRYNSIGPEEALAVQRVLEGGVLSQFLGAWHDDFYGGPQVRKFEREWATKFGTRNAVAVNSATSGLISALGSIGIEPGDEVIVSPWTMSASATAILHWNAIPVFADIEPATFNIDPKSVKARITPYTRAIVAVDIFGHSADIDALMAVAATHGLKVVSDSAQAPGALYKGRLAGTDAHIGVYSLNYHKHIHTGEGGVVVSNDDVLAERVRLIRNHAEAVVGDKGESDLRNMIGHNFRLGEIEAAIGNEQLRKLAPLVARRQRIAERLNAGLQGLSGLRTPVVRSDCTHVYYVYPLVIDPRVLGVGRARIHSALQAEGLPVWSGYQNIHLLPMYQTKTAYGSRGFPWRSDICKREVDYGKGICPVAETLHDETYMGIGLCIYDLSDDDVDLLVLAIRKVWGCLDSLH